MVKTHFMKYRLIKPLEGFETGEVFTFLHETPGGYMVMLRDNRPDQQVSFSLETVNALFEKTPS